MQEQRSAPRSAHSKQVFVGFGFGAIQSGLFLYEAQAGGRFDRLVVSEISKSRVKALRDNHGTYTVNIAHRDQRLSRDVRHVEILNPMDPADAERLVEAIADASHIATALPDIGLYRCGHPSVVDLLREGLARKSADLSLPPGMIYTAENHNHAAEHLERALSGIQPRRFQALNTVIGKMSSVIQGLERIQQLNLSPMVPGGSEAILVEAFNRILVSRITLPDADRGFVIFEEKDHLLPFEEAKLYGHNAIHALLGWLAHSRNLTTMSELSKHPDLLDIGRDAFMEEAGAALIMKYNGTDPLFTRAGWKTYADDLLDRMINPWLHDPVERVIRDPVRKLGWHDRMVGCIRLVSSQGIEPRRLLRVASIAYAELDDPMRTQLRERWKVDGATPEEIEAMIARLQAPATGQGVYISPVQHPVRTPRSNG